MKAGAMWEGARNEWGCIRMFAGKGRLLVGLFVLIFYNVGVFSFNFFDAVFALVWFRFLFCALFVFPVFFFFLTSGEGKGEEYAD